MKDKKALTIRDAALRVLGESKGPLHVKEITERILTMGLWDTSGQTPEASVAAAINSDIKKRGNASPFARTEPGTFTLQATNATGEAVSDPQPGTASEPGQLTHVKTYSFTDSAEKVLETLGKQQPMHYRAITQQALEMGFLVSKGKTPEATMYAQILTEIKRYQRRHEHPRFVKHGNGLIGLSGEIELSLGNQIAQHNRQTSKALHKRLLEMEWNTFEEFVARMLSELGFDDIEVTSGTRDGGIDVRATLVVGEVIRTRMAVQVKKWKNNVQSPVVQQVRGSLGSHEQGLIITTSDFSRGAREEAARSDAVPVALMNGEQLVALLVENEIGVRRRPHDLIELDNIET